MSHSMLGEKKEKKKHPTGIMYKVSKVLLVWMKSTYIQNLKTDGKRRFFKLKTEHISLPMQHIFFSFFLSFLWIWIHTVFHCSYFGFCYILNNSMYLYVCMWMWINKSMTLYIFAEICELWDYLHSLFNFFFYFKFN